MRHTPRARLRRGARQHRLRCADPTAAKHAIAIIEDAGLTGRYPRLASLQDHLGRTATRVVDGAYEAVQRVAGRTWRIPVTAFWQAHRDAPDCYSTVVGQWAQLSAGMTAWDLYGGAGIFAATTLLVGRLPNHVVALAAHQIAINAASVTFMVPLGIGMAGAIRVGQAAGRGDADGARRAGWMASVSSSPRYVETSS